MEQATANRLNAAQLTVVVSAAYYGMLYAARAAEPIAAVERLLAN